MFITRKRYFKELEKANDLYLAAMKRITEFHQQRDEGIMAVLSDWENKFKNISATKCLYRIKEILTHNPNEGNGESK